MKIKEEEEQTLVEKQVIEIYKNILIYDEITHSIYCFLPLIEISNDVNKEFMGVSDSRKLSYSYFMRNIDKFKFLLQDLLDTEEKDWTESHFELSKIAIQLQQMTQFHYAQSLKIIPGNDNNTWLSPWEMMDGRPMSTSQKQILSLYEDLVYFSILKDYDNIDMCSNNIVKHIGESVDSINTNLLLKVLNFEFLER